MIVVKAVLGIYFEIMLLYYYSYHCWPALIYFKVIYLVPMLSRHGTECAGAVIVLFYNKRKVMI